VLILYLLPIFPLHCNHQTVISIIFSSPERSYIECTRMPSPTYQYVIYLVVILPIRRGPGVSCLGVGTSSCLQLDFWCGEIYYSNIIIIISLMQTLIPNYRFENITSPQICVKIS